MAAHVDGRVGLGGGHDRPGAEGRGGVQPRAHRRDRDDGDRRPGAGGVSANVLIACDLLSAAGAGRAGALRQGPHGGGGQRRLRADRRLRHRPRRALRRRRAGPADRGGGEVLRRRAGQPPGRDQPGRRHLRQHDHAGLRLAEGRDPGLQPRALPRDPPERRGRRGQPPGLRAGPQGRLRPGRAAASARTTSPTPGDHAAGRADRASRGRADAPTRTQAYAAPLPGDRVAGCAPPRRRWAPTP